MKFHENPSGHRADASAEQTDRRNGRRDMTKLIDTCQTLKDTEYFVRSDGLATSTAFK
jgi:hypothetical protein